MTLLSAPLSESLMKMYMLYGDTSPNELIEMQIKNKRTKRAQDHAECLCWPMTIPEDGRLSIE